MARQSERRRSPRTSYDQLIEIRIQGQETKVVTQARNIAIGGIYVECDPPLPEGTVVEVFLTLPNMKEPVSAQGRVVRCDNLSRKGGLDSVSGMAIEFAGSSPSTAKLIHDLVALGTGYVAR